MRAVLFALIAATGCVACKIDLDKIPRPDAADPNARLCEDKTVAVCLEAANHSDFQWIQDNMFSTNCSGDDCHGAAKNGQPPSGKLILAQGSAYATLLGKAASDPGPAPLVASAFTADHKLVEPGAPHKSYLVYMLQALKADEGVPRFTAPPDDIGFMPQNNKPLCCQKLDAVSRWIEAGALP